MDDIYKTIDTIIASQKKARSRNDYDTLLLNGEACLEYAYQLIIYGVEQESAYRKYEAGLADGVDENGKKNTGAYCETKAKATPEYREWQKAKLVVELLYDLANMGKALAKGVDRTLQALN